MVDTVNFKITRAEVERVDFLQETTAHLNPEGWGFHNYGGMEVVTGRLDGLSVSITPYQVRVKDGSLCKWMLGDNYQAMTRTDIKRAVERLSDTLHLPMRKAIITRLDVGLSIPVRQPTACYFNHLGLLKWATRLAQPNGLYYYRHRQAERLCFYDKNRESREHREAIPDLYQDTNILRYEQRYMAQLPALLGVPQVTGARLYDESFYIDLLNRWREAYQDIRKINEITLNFQAMRSKQQLNKMGVLALAERMGGEVEMIAHINEAQKRGELTAKQAFDLRQAVKEACNVAEDMTTPSEAIAELDKKIREAIKFYR